MFLLAAAIGDTKVKESLVAGDKKDSVAESTPSVEINQNLVAPPSSPDSVLHCNDYRRRRKRIGVTWSDNDGGVLEHVRFIPARELTDPSGTKRLIILLLSPAHRKYEFICCEYKLDTTEVSKSRCKITVKDVLEQIPRLASHELMKKQTYVALCRRDNTELINALSIQSFELNNFEMLWAVPKHHHSKQLAPMVSCVLANKGLLKALKYSSVHWEVHRLKARPKQQATAILDKLNMKQRKLLLDGDSTWPSSDEEDEAQLKRTFPLCPQPSPEGLRLSPSLLSMLRTPSMSFARPPSLLRSLFSKDRGHVAAERRQRLMVTLFAGAGVFLRKHLKESVESDKRQQQNSLLLDGTGGLFDEERFSI